MTARAPRRIHPLTLVLLLAACAPGVAASPPPAAPRVSAPADPDQVAIGEMIETFRSGIIARDASKLVPLFLNEAVPFCGVAIRDGAPRPFVTDAGAFIRDVVGAKLPWDERFSDVDIRVDAGVAAMVSRYGFYEDQKMTNQGQEIWSLVKTKDGWRIVSVIWSVKPPAS